VPRTRRPSGDRPDVVLHYEGALCPELTLHTDIQDLWGSLDELLRLAQRLQRAATVKDYAPKPSVTS